MERSKLIVLKEKSYKYEKLRHHKKNMLLISKVVVGNTISRAKDALRAIIVKQKAVEGKYPQKCSRVLYAILSNIETSLKNQKQSLEEKEPVLYIKHMLVNKGPTLGVVGIPRARGTTSPKYLATTNLYFTCLVLKNEKISS